MIAYDVPNIAEVLAEVNRIRAEHNIGEPLERLPGGERRTCDRCPLARALSAKGALAHVGRTDADLGIKRGVIDLPPILEWFTVAFDTGEYQELIA